MKMLLTFWKTEEGAVTVDWVVLAAVLAALTAAVYVWFESGAEQLEQAPATYYYD